MSFHPRCGRRITLANSNRTAMRNISDFNHGIVISSEPLIDDMLFEIRIDEKNHSWSGSIEIGVTTENPECLELPSCATKMRAGTWLMSGISVLKDGISLIEYYGTDLDTLTEGDQVGVVRTAQDELIFYVNGESQGVAATNIPKIIYALVNLYGKCVQVSITPPDSLEYSMNTTTQAVVQILGSTPIAVDVSVTASPAVINPLNSSQIGDFLDVNDRLRFHNRCGSLVKLSPNSRTAERRRPLDEFNNGVVMTHRSLKDNELFEIRIDKLVDKWSGSIEVGVTTHNPIALHFPATMTNMRSGTIMMSGCGILTNGKGTRRQYGEFNLDELREGDRVGMMRKVSGNLHYYINGQDQGVAATRVAQILWGVIDLYGMTIKVTIVDRDEREQQNLVTRRNNLILNQNGNTSGVANVVVRELHETMLSPDMELIGSRNEDRLTFHQICGSHATVTHSGRTALRPNASDDFNNGVVLTRRYLRPNEFFQVRLERVVTKWAGSIEMGVTTHSAQELEFPFTMTNVRSGTWMMTGNGVMHNGTTVIEQYGQNLDRLQVGDRVGVVRKDDGTLHFWVNGVDQGIAGTCVPENIYGVIDLYGQAAQASIVDTSECGSPDTGNSTISNTTLYSEPPLRFHPVHGKNARITNGGVTASRPKALAEFNDAIVFSNRPLRQRELFEVVLETMVAHWSGNIEIGITGVRPDEIQLTANATDLEYDTIILCGSVVFHNRKTIRNNIPFDLNTLSSGTKVGVMRNGDFIHFFIDGIDQGPACECRMPSIWAVCDVYGKCAQVSLTLSQPDMRAPYATSENSQSFQVTSVIQPSLGTKHRWGINSENVTFSQNYTTASRITGCSAALSRCLLFSENIISIGSPFEIKITSHNPLFAGCLTIGVTDLNLVDEYVRKTIPVSIKRIPANVWYISGNEVRHNSSLLQRSLASLEWLRVGDRITLELTPARVLRILLNSEDMNINFTNVPFDVFVVAELQGSTMAVQVVSSEGPTSPLRPCSLRLQDSLEFCIDPLNKQDSMLESIDSETLLFEFCDYCGKNIKLLDDRRSAVRQKSYNHGIVVITKPLCKGHSVSIKIDAINTKWKGTIGIGALGHSPHTTNYQLPSSIVSCRRPCWVCTHDYININGNKIASNYADTLNDIQPGTVITLSLSHAGTLSLTVGQTNIEELAAGLPNHVFPILDLYGKCEKISIINGEMRNGTPIIEEVALEHDQLVELDGNVRHCEKADLEVHEKETECVPVQTIAAPAVAEVIVPVGSADSNAGVGSSVMTTSAMNRSVMENMSENLLLNISIKNRSLESRIEPVSSTSACCLSESLQLQHNTNLNIQRSQSTQRFNSLTTLNNNDTNKGQIEPPCQDVVQAPLIPNPAVVPLLQSPNNNTNSIETIQQQIHDTEDNEPTIMQQQPQQQLLDSNQIIETADDEDTSSNIEEITRQLSDTQIDSLNTYRSYSDFESIPSIETKDCEYLKLVCGFKRTLVLPDAFFQHKPPVCFCHNCYSLGTSRLNENSHCLINWVYFKLNSQVINPSSTTTAAATTVQNSESGDWMRLYYVTRVDKIRAILDHGEPLTIDTNHISHTNNSPNQKDEPGTHLLLHWCPPPDLKAINLAHRYNSGLSGYTIETVFEVLVRKQALCFATTHEQQPQQPQQPAPNINNSGGQSSIDDGNNHPNDTDEQNNGACSNNNINNQQITNLDSTMFTKEAGACMLTALILKLKPIDGGILEGHHSKI